MLQIINRNISIPNIPDPKQVILYGKGEKPPIIIKIIPVKCAQNYPEKLHQTLLK